MEPPHGTGRRTAAVVAGAVVGGLLRHGQAALLDGAAGTLPWGTLTINVAGSLALAAFLAALLDTPRAHPLWRPFFAVGFCGTYTTFSSFEGETLSLLRSEPRVGAAYVLASVLAGVGGALAVWLLVRRARRAWPLLEREPPLRAAPALALALALVAAVVLERARGLDLSTLALGCVVVAVGGSLGALARWGVSAGATAKLGSRFPWATLLINATGSFLIGLYDGAVRGRADVSPLVRLLLVTGCLGGYTTFSTFACETTVLAAEDGRKRAVANVAASLALGLAAAWAGDALAKLV